MATSLKLNLETAPLDGVRRHSTLPGLPTAAARVDAGDGISIVPDYAIWVHANAFWARLDAIISAGCADVAFCDLVDSRKFAAQLTKCKTGSRPNGHVSPACQCRK